MARQAANLIFLRSTPRTNLLVVSLISAIFFIYPNITMFSMEREYLGEEKHTVHLLYFIFRYLYFSAFIWILLRHNILKLKTNSVTKRWGQSFIITFAAYLIYVGFSITLSPKHEWLSSIMLFQFLIMFIYCTLFGQVINLYSDQRQNEQEIEQLKLENLQSRYDALTQQINPHFFFNSLNSLTWLIRRKNEDITLAYVNKLSDVFRYILQSDKKVLVTLGEELEFVRAFSYMMEVRFANKLGYNIDVPAEKRDLKIPVLSLLPLIENVAVHNTIDSEHKMEVKIWLNDRYGAGGIMSCLSRNSFRPIQTGQDLKTLKAVFPC